MQRNAYHSPPNPKYAITFAFVSIVVLMLPLFWSPLNNQPINSYATQAAEVSPTPVASAVPVGPQLTPAPQATAAELQPQAAAQPLGPPPEPTQEFSGHLRRVVFSLLVVTVLIGVTLKALQSRLPGMVGRKTGSFLNILAREAIGPTQSLALVQVGPKVLLVGLCEQSMTTLCEFSEAELLAMMPAEDSEAGERPTAKSMYADILRHYLSIVPGMGGAKK